MQTLATRNNNPGNIKDQNTGTFKTFSTPQDGYAALLNDLQAKKTGTTTTGVGPGSTLADFAKVYAPESDKNNPAQYTANLANHMGVRPDAKLESLDVGKWADAVAHAEGYSQNGQVQADQNNPSSTATQTTPQSPQEQPGFVQSLVRGIANPFMRAGANVAKIGQTLAGQNVDASAPVSYGNYLGEATPIGQEGDIGQKIKDSLGTGLSLASNLAFPEAVGAAKVATIGGKILKGITQGTKAGAIGGGLFGAGEAAQENKGMGSILGYGALGGITGGITGGILGGALGVPMAAKNFIKPSEKTVLDNRNTVLNDLANRYARVGKATEGAQKYGNDVIKRVSESNLLENAVDENGLINTELAQSRVKKGVEPYEDVVTKILEKEGNTINISDVSKQLQSSIMSSGLDGAPLLTALNTAKKDLAALRLRADKYGNVPVARLQTAKISKTKSLNYNDPEKSIADKLIASQFRTIIEANTKSADVRSINAELQKEFQLIDFLESLNGTRVQGGRLGKYFAGTLGGMVGSHFGPFGVPVGSMVTSKLHGASMARTFGKGGLSPEVSEVLQNALTGLSNPKKPLLALPAPTKQTIEASKLLKPSSTIQLSGKTEPGLIWVGGKKPPSSFDEGVKRLQEQKKAGTAPEKTEVTKEGVVQYGKSKYKPPKFPTVKY